MPYGLLRHKLVRSYGGKTGTGEALGASAAQIEAARSQAQQLPAGTFATAINAEDMARLAAHAIDVECCPGDLVLFSNVLVHLEYSPALYQTFPKLAAPALGIL
jgi:hypothetical protein